MAASPIPDVFAVAALRRLLDLAHGDTGQSGRAANFLLAWWNATSCGGWDLAELWAVDRAAADDMLGVARLVLDSHAYPSFLGLQEEFGGLVARWRPHLLTEPD